MTTPSPEVCEACGRRPGWTQDGTYRRHRIDANDPLSAWCRLSPPKDGRR